MIDGRGQTGALERVGEELRAHGSYHPQWTFFVQCSARQCQKLAPLDRRANERGAPVRAVARQSSGRRVRVGASVPARSQPPEYAITGSPIRIAARLSTGTWPSQCSSRWYQASNAR